MCQEPILSDPLKQGWTYSRLRFRPVRETQKLVPILIGNSLTGVVGSVPLRQRCDSHPRTNSRLLPRASGHPFHPYFHLRGIVIRRWGIWPALVAAPFLPMASGSAANDEGAVAPNVISMPSSIKADCSVADSGILSNWLNSLPAQLDGQFPGKRVLPDQLNPVGISPSCRRMKTRT